MTLPPKAVSTLCVLQSAIIVGSYLLACTFNKVVSKFEQETYGAVPSSMPWLARAFVAGGPWLLLVPFIWAGSSIVTASRERGIVEISELRTRLGYAITIMLALFCVASVWKAFLGAFVYPFQTN